jgi:fructoselysine-6-P-deglycase FrlB-like protein
MVSERPQEKGTLVTIKVNGLRARIAADLVERVIQQLKQQGATVVVIEEQGHELDASIYRAGGGKLGA